MKKNKIIIVLPGFNAAKTIKNVIDKISKEYHDQIILIDDNSEDNTFEIGKKIGLETYRNPFNMGYGGNLKMCLLKALEKGADVIVELHPDGEYDPASISRAVEEINKGADFVLGNRFFSFWAPFGTGMPLWKFIPNRVLSLVQGKILGTQIADLHQGFRVYTRRLLEKINFTTNSDNYLFSFEIIAQAKFNKLKITEVPVKCRYTGKKKGASFKNSVLYSLGTFNVLLEFLLAKTGIKNKLFTFKKINISCNVCGKKDFLQEKYESEDFVTQKKFKIYYCHFCKNAFTFPQPEDINLYYPIPYYKNDLSLIKKYLYSFFQRRRIKEILSYKKNGSVLDIGSGEGVICNSLKKNGYLYTGMDASFSSLYNKEILKKDLLSFSFKEKYDLITFWESLEHMYSPRKILAKAGDLLKENGIILVEVPRFCSLESVIFGKKWYHLSPPRHLSHFTSGGLKRLLEMEGFCVIKQKNIFAFEYSVWGFIQSLLNFFQSQEKATAILIRKKNTSKKMLFVFPALVTLPIAILAEIFFYLMGSSPILLSVASRRK